VKKIITDKQTIDKLIEDFSRTTDEVFSLEEFRKLLSSGHQLRFKYGVDVTAPDLHIGHAVNLWMYRRLQELGHKIIFLIGDYTTQIGDPTGKSKTRPIIPIEEIQQNADAFIKQAMMVLYDDPNLVEIRRNSEWYDPMKAKDLLSLMSLVTHDRLISRDMFQKRIETGQEIYENELVYPILQGYDSVALKADATVIGSDQLFNEMMGRFFQEKYGEPAQVIITTKITAGIDGKGKQSKSLGNYIGLNHSPREKFGRLMSIPDTLIIDYMKVYTDVPLDEIVKIEQDLSTDPKKYKLMLAQEIVKRYHGEKVAEEEVEWFEKTFSQKQVPDEAIPVSIGADSASLIDILKKCFDDEKMSNNDLRRLITQNAVTIDERKANDPFELIKLSSSPLNFKVGKRNWFKVTI